MGNCCSKTKTSREVKRSSIKLQTPEVVYHKIPEECTTLKLSLVTAHKEKEAAEEEVQLLNRRVHSLENVVRDLQESVEHASLVDKERKVALQLLQQKQTQLDQLRQVNSSIETEHSQTLSALNKLVVELEEKMRVDEERRIELTKELLRLQKEADEREKIFAEFERSRQELVKKRLDLDIIPAPVVTSINQVVLPTNVNHRDEEDNKQAEEAAVRKKLQRKSWNQNEEYNEESLLSVWAQKGPIAVCVAKYNYDPFELSPNENPEVELPLTAGDYVLVVGEMDEDGFFDGELIDGSQGLVPSNYIEKIEDRSLLNFHEALMHAGHREYSLTGHRESNLTGHREYSLTGHRESSLTGHREYSLTNQRDYSLKGHTESSIQGYSESSLQGHTESSPRGYSESSLQGHRESNLTEHDPANLRMSSSVSTPTPAIFSRLTNIINGNREDLYFSKEGTRHLITETLSNEVCGTEDIKSTSSELSVHSSASSVVRSVGSGLVLHPWPALEEISEDQHMEPSDGEEDQSRNTDEEIDEAFRDYPTEGVDGDNESYTGSSRTELSDIPEVEEDQIGSQDSHLNEVGSSSTNQMHPFSQVTRRLPDQAADMTLPSQVNNPAIEADGRKQISPAAGKLMAALAGVVLATEGNDTEQQSKIVHGKEDNTRSKENNLHSKDNNIPRQETISRDLTGKKQKPDTDSSRHDYTDAPNQSYICHGDQTAHIMEPIQPAVMEGKSHQCNDSHSSAQRPRTHSPRSRPPKLQLHSSNDDLHFVQSKSKHRTSQRPLSDSALSPQISNNWITHPSSPIHALDDSISCGSLSEQINPIAKETSVRLFIALFDYDPATMSPNVDSVGDELPFREGQILKVFGHKDADGFYRGENKGRVGYIPCNMVCEVQIDDSDLLEKLLQEVADDQGQIQHASANSQPVGAHMIPNGGVSIPREDNSAKQMTALFDYNPRELFPHPDAEELSFKIGDRVMVYGDVNQDGFYTGEVNNKRGLVPSNFLRPAPSFDSRWESTSLSRARSCESLERALEILERSAVKTNSTNVKELLSSQLETINSNKQSVNASISEIKLCSSRSFNASPSKDEKLKTEGFFSKGKNILKKFTR